MSAYFERPEGKIRADFALRIGRLFCDYEKRLVSLAKSERFDATLTITLLQSLLTTCAELIKSVDEQKPFLNKLSDVPSLWGLRSGMVVQNTFPGVLTHKLVLEYMRNALSHPNYGDVTHKYPVSGFQNLNENGEIVGFSFVNSPDIKQEGVVQSYRGETKPTKTKPETNPAKTKLDKLREEFKRAKDSRELELQKKTNGKYEICCDGVPYVRVFQIDVPLSSLKKLLRELSNHLAQPTRKYWDGHSVVELVA